MNILHPINAFPISFFPKKLKQIHINVIYIIYVLAIKNDLSVVFSYTKGRYLEFRLQDVFLS